jgi:predicted Zn-dependent protease
MSNMQTYFQEFSAHLDTCIQGDEVWLAYLAAEESNFVRFNKNAVRQAGSVKQMLVTISLVGHQRCAESRITLTGESVEDFALAKLHIEKLRATLAELPEDPYLIYNTTPTSSELITRGALPADGDMLDAILRAGHGLDLVGLYSSGAIVRGFANSLGQRNWHHIENFNFDWSLYYSTDKAVKQSYAGTTWDSSTLSRKMAEGSAQLEVLGGPPKTLTPGAYRAWLTPTAMSEITSLLSWGGFGAKSQRTKQSPLMKLEDASASLHEGITLREVAADGVAPMFNGDGFIKTPSVALIERGKHASALVSARSAREYGIPNNGANGEEVPESLDMAGGALADADRLSALDTGLLIGNLWYLNYSDRGSCRMTGMTRFATFWVENGKIAAPVNVMRFDDSAYRMLGDNLVGLSTEREWILDNGSYGERSTGSARLPGALVKDMQFTL